MVIKGKVVRGLGMGHKLGYPTANLEHSGHAPEDGVYVARAGEYCAVVIVGARPNLLEVFILDFDGDLYGQEFEVELLEKVSDIERCEDEAKLKHKIEEDIRKVRLCLQG